MRRPPMFLQFLAIVRNTFVESLRQPIFFVLVMAGGIMQVMNLLLSAYSMGYTTETEVSKDDKLLLDMGLATVLGVATLLAAFVATNVLAREIENKTALTVISKPVGRPLFILGKYIGAAGAIVVAVLILLVFLSFAIRHEVMSTARDNLDLVVILFGGLAVLTSIGLGIWCNFFYGWSFPATAIGTLLPTSIAAYVVTLFVGEGFALQSPAEQFKPQIMIASACLIMAMLVLTAVAVACSTRLGHVMTVVVCAGIFLLGLLSNHLLGRHAFENRHIAQVEAVAFEAGRTTDMRESGDEVTITLDTQPRLDLEVGDPIWYGPSPSGVALAVPASNAPITADLDDPETPVTPGLGPALVIKRFDPETLEAILINIGDLPVKRPPRAGDFLFAQPTRVNLGARIAWSVVPNLQFFWLVDAITQGHEITPRYLGLVAGYTAVQVIGLLALSTLLFQRRDVG